MKVATVNIKTIFIILIRVKQICSPTNVEEENIRQPIGFLPGTLYQGASRIRFLEHQYYLRKAMDFNLSATFCFQSRRKNNVTIKRIIMFTIVTEFQTIKYRK